MNCRDLKHYRFASSSRCCNKDISIGFICIGIFHLCQNIINYIKLIFFNTFYIFIGTYILIYFKIPKFILFPKLLQNIIREPLKTRKKMPTMV